MHDLIKMTSTSKINVLELAFSEVSCYGHRAYITHTTVVTNHIYPQLLQDKFIEITLVTLLQKDLKSLSALVGQIKDRE